MPKRKNRLILWGAIFLLTATGFTYMLWPRPVFVDLVEVTRGDMDVRITQDGKTRIRDIYKMTAPLPGHLKQIEVEAGDQVIGGETIIARITAMDPLMLDARTLQQQESLIAAAQAAIKVAEAEQVKAQSEYAFARTEYENSKKLYAAETISQTALERYQTTLRSRDAAVSAARAALAMRRSELEMAKAKLIIPNPDARGTDAEECIDIHAPEDGIILHVHRESAGVVLLGEPLMEIGNPADLEIVADLLSTDAVALPEKAPVLIRGWGGNQILKGTLRRVEPFGYTKVSALGVEEQRVDVIIDFDDPRQAWRKLGHGYRVKLDLLQWRGSEVLRMPVSALFRDGSNWATFVVRNKKVYLSKIEVGKMNGQQAEVVRGLAEGDILVSYPSDRVLDGTYVAARR